MEQLHHRRKRRPGLLVAAGLISVGLIAAACGSDKKESTNTTTAEPEHDGGGRRSVDDRRARPRRPQATTTTVGSSRRRAASSWSASRPRRPTRGRRPTCSATRPARCGPARSSSRSAAYNDETKKVEPYLAKSITPNADSTEWTIGLRDGITFTDGTPLNADAVVDNLEPGPEVASCVGAGAQGHHRRDQGRRQDREDHDSRGRGTTSPTTSTGQGVVHGLADVAGRGRRRPEQGDPAGRHRAVHGRRRSSRARA